MLIQVLQSDEMDTDSSITVMAGAAAMQPAKLIIN